MTNTTDHMPHDDHGPAFGDAPGGAVPGGMYTPVAADAQSVWHTQHEEYLAAALHWLRLRLERNAVQSGPIIESAVALPPAAPEAVPFFQRFMRPHPEVHADQPLAIAPPPPVSEEQIQQAAADMDAREAQMNPPPALATLRDRLGLSRFEQDALLLCVAMELDTRIAGLCARAQDDPNRPYPTFALALTLFDDPSWDMLSPARPLRYWRLIEITQPGSTPLTVSPLRADERIVHYIKGLDYLDDRLSPLLAPLSEEDLASPLPDSQQTLVAYILRRWSLAAPHMPPPAVQLLGADAEDKRTIAGHVVSALGRSGFQLPVEFLPLQAADLETLALLWHRESLLLPVALYVDAQNLDAAPGTEAITAALSRFLARCAGIVFVATREPVSVPGSAAFAADVERPTQGEQQAAWSNAVGAESPDSPARLAGQFDLSLPAIDRIAALAGAEAENPQALPDRLWDECRERARPRMEALAQRLEAKATWDDIVLPDEQVSLLRQIAGQVGQRSRVYEEWGFARKMSRGLGISALFYGDSGVGKTMAAEVLANHLRLDLYRIDLSAVMSKYIGDTERNIRRLFDAFENGGAILFFDEADALFSKRSEVKDSHDRYANIETDYLLQRMEAYRGLAILATNMKSALDTAFMRRLRFALEFRFPGPAERLRIWERVFPAGAPVVDLDFERLARLNLTGGSIRNIALNAAFLAAGEGGSITMAQVLSAARTEFSKNNWPINETQFRWEAPPAQDSSSVVIAGVR